MQRTPAAHSGVFFHGHLVLGNVSCAPAFWEEMRRQRCVAWQRAHPPPLLPSRARMWKPPQQVLTVRLHRLYINIRMYKYTYKETKPFIKSFWFADDMMGLFPSHCVRSPCHVTQETETPQVVPSPLPGDRGVVTTLLVPLPAFSLSLIKTRKITRLLPSVIPPRCLSWG